MTAENLVLMLHNLIGVDGAGRVDFGSHHHPRYNDFDIIFGPYLAHSRPYTTPHAPWATLCLVPMLIWC